MKKILVASVVLASVCVSLSSFTRQPVAREGEVRTNVSAQGRGACTHVGCRCQKFDQEPGHYRCWCGHQDYVHK